MNNMVDTRDIIIQLKKVRAERELSFGDILQMLEEKDYFLSKTTLSRVFADGSEDIKFRYEDTLKPIVSVLLDIDTIEESDTNDVKMMKLTLQYKMERIEELERQLELEQANTLKRVDEERAKNEDFINFLKDQLSYKDKRMDEFMNAVKEKDAQIAGLLDHITNCPFRKAQNED